jgi:ATP-dependent HslUV protease subunit HslV
MMRDNDMTMHATTILAVMKNGEVAMAGDGQVTLGNTTMKGNARKVRTLNDGKIVIGFAGATADAFTLFERFEAKVNEYNGDITRSAVELAKEWRTDRMLQKLEAMLLVASKEKILLISGTGDVVEPETGAIAIGSGGNYAYAAALAFLENQELSAAEVARKSLGIAARICIYTNDNIIVEEVQ